MIPSPQIDTLAESMLQRRLERQVQSMVNAPTDAVMEPYILFIGEEFARQVGVPGVEHIALDMFIDLSKRDEKLVQEYLSPADWQRAQRELGHDRSRYDWRNPTPATRVLVKAAYELWSRQSPIVRYSTLQRLYSGYPVPSPFQDLAALIKAGYFTRIMTTNVDTMLEQALQLIGLPRDYYEVVNLGSEPTRTKRDLAYSTTAPVRIVKLPPEPARQRYPVQSHEITDVLRVARGYSDNPQREDTLMVGTYGRYEPLSEWLLSTEGEVWWIGTDTPDIVGLSGTSGNRQVHYMQPDSISLDEFFGQLALRLLVPSGTIGSPWETESEPEVAQSRDIAPLVKGTPEEQPVSENALAIRYLQEQLKRSRSVLYNLSLAAAQGDRKAQAQVETMRQQVADLETELQKLSQNRVKELMQEIVEAAAGAVKDPGLVSYLRGQVTAINKEYRKKDPNQYVVSASILSTVSVAKSLSPDIVDPKMVLELEAFAPPLAKSA